MCVRACVRMRVRVRTSERYSYSHVQNSDFLIKYISKSFYKNTLERGNISGVTSTQARLIFSFIFSIVVGVVDNIQSFIKFQRKKI